MCSPAFTPHSSEVQPSGVPQCKEPPLPLSMVRFSRVFAGHSSNSLQGGGDGPIRGVSSCFSLIPEPQPAGPLSLLRPGKPTPSEIGRASCRERV